jgi:hypothetical protein
MSGTDPPPYRHNQVFRGPRHLLVDPTLRMAAQVARALGDLTIVGLGGGALPVDFSSPPHECAVTSPYWGYITELMEVITPAAAGATRAQVRSRDGSGPTFLLARSAAWTAATCLRNPSASWWPFSVRTRDRR